MKIEENVPLSKLTSLHVGGPARYVVSVTSDQEIEEAVALATEKKLPFFVLGKGSNTLFPDAGYDGVIILMANRQISFEGDVAIVEAGMFMRLLVVKAHEQGLVGLEELAGIPGTIGGAVRGNGGTWHTEVKNVLASATVYRPNADGKYEWVEMSNAECNFGYRDSIFKKHPDWIVVRVRLNLHKGDVEAGKAAVTKDLTDRHTKQPYDAPSAGSVFKNPDKGNGVFSGKLIEAAGLKGTVVGGAEISPKHGNFIVNRGGATSSDIEQLVNLAKTTVAEKFGVKLEPEIEIVKKGGA